MSLILSGTDGLSDVDGSAATPAIRGTDANTGIFFPAADTIAFAEGGVEAMRIDSSGNVGIGTSSPSYRLDVSATSFIAANVSTSYSGAGNIRIADASTTSASAPYIGSAGNNLTFGRIGTAEYARIDSSGNLLVGTTSNLGKFTVSSACNTVKTGLVVANTDTGAGTFAGFLNSAGNTAGAITQTGTTTVNYGTSSDYRLKTEILPMEGALAKVEALKPCTYKWKDDGASGEGFIAHELAEIVPQCVVGKKDEVDAEGKPVYQTIDTSFLVATLTAAIQEQQALITALTARIEALETP